MPRSVRVTIIRSANRVLPPSATSAGQPNAAEVGCSAITTPTKPTATAVHRRQPTCSFRMSAASSVT